MIERFDGVAAEEAEHELASGSEHPRELGNRRCYRIGLVVDGGEPGEDAIEFPVCFVDGVNASNTEWDAGVCRPGVLDEGGHEIDAPGLEPALSQVVRPVARAASGVQDPPPDALRPGIDELSVGRMHC